MLLYSFGQIDTKMGSVLHLMNVWMIQTKSSVVMSSNKDSKYSKDGVGASIY